MNFFNRIRERIRELKNKPLIQEKERLQAETAEIEQKIKNIERDYETRSANLKLSEDELTKIKKQLADKNRYIYITRLYSAQLKIISYYPSIEKQAKGLGLVGKSSSELQHIIEIREKELEPLKNKESEVRRNIKKEKDIVDKINLQLKILREKISSNNARIQEIDKKTAYNSNGICWNC